MNGVEAKIWLEIFMIVLATSVITSILTALLMMLVVRAPKVPQMPDEKAGEWRTESWTRAIDKSEAIISASAVISASESLVNLKIPDYLQVRLIEGHIKTISHLGMLVESPAGKKAKWPYGLGPVRQKIIKGAYAEWDYSQVKKDIEGEGNEQP
ncbi:MAG: hypothetical protein MUO24_02310 [Desulfobacterales bacterium]|nr:hypothetical protein [Desulfobacterales bacterium]